MADADAGRPTAPRPGAADADEFLLASLAEALTALDPVPAHLLEVARGSLTWRTVDADLAELVADSALEPSGTRGRRTQPRTLTFSVGETTVVVEVAGEGALRRLLGQVVMPRPAEVEVRHARGTSTVQTDDLGRFRLDAVPAGPLSLACTFAGSVQPSLVTSWVTV